MKKLAILAFTAALLLSNSDISYAAAQHGDNDEHERRLGYGDDMREVPRSSLLPDNDPSFVRIQPVGRVQIIHVEDKEFGDLLFHIEDGEIASIKNREGKKFKIAPVEVKRNKKARY